MLSDTIHLGEVKIVARRNNASSANYVTQTAYAVQRVAVGIPTILLRLPPRIKDSPISETLSEREFQE